jgi:antitoxin component YwqK of YwqJK toxin-antitoxin module
MKGQYVQGKPDGRWIQWSRSGVELGSFELRQGTGTFLRWHENGRVFVAAAIDSGELRGPFRVWYDNGQRAVEGTYAGGGKHFIDAVSFILASAGDLASPRPSTDLHGTKHGTWSYWR